MATLIDSYSESNRTSNLNLNPSYPERGQSFEGKNAYLDSCIFQLAKITGTISGNAYACLYEHSGTFGTSSVPTGEPLATSGAVSIAGLGTTPTLKTFTFSGANRYKMKENTYYIIAVKHPDSTASSYTGVGSDNTSPSHPGNNSRPVSGVWTASTQYDLCFYVYGDLYSTSERTLFLNATYGSRYWVGGTGAWSDTGHWSMTSGGSGGASVPTDSHNVYIDGNSGFSSGGTITIDDNNATCHDLICNSGHTFTLTGGSDWLYIYGDTILESGLTITNEVNLSFKGDEDRTITTNGATIQINQIDIEIDSSATITLQDDFLCDTANEFTYIYHYTGTLDANDNDLRYSSIYIDTDATVVMGSGTWESVYEGFSCYGAVTCGTSTVKLSGNTFHEQYFQADGQIFYNLWFAGTNSENYGIYGSNTFNQIKVSSEDQTILFGDGDTQTITSLDIVKSSGHTTTIDSTSSPLFYGTGTSGTQIKLYNGSNTKVSQSFTGDGGRLKKARIFIRSSGSPTGNITAEIFAHSGTFGTSSVPTGTALATAETLAATSSMWNYYELEFTGANAITLEDGTNYVLVISYSGGDASNYIYLNATTANASGGNYAVYNGSWSATATLDLYYVNVYVDGQAYLFKESGDVLCDYLDLSNSSATTSPYGVAPTTYSWTTLTGSATAVTTFGDTDEGISSEISLPFTFDFYGNSYSSVWICTNGAIRFDDNGALDYNITAIPNKNLDFANSIFGYATDLVCNNTGSVSYETFGTSGNRVFVVQFDSVPTYSENATVTFQIKLFESDNHIEVHTDSAGADSYEAAMQGISNSDCSAALTPAGRNAVSPLTLSEDAITFQVAESVARFFAGAHSTDTYDNDGWLFESPTGDSERLLYLDASLTSSSERSMYLTGSLSNSLQRSLYLTGCLDSNSERGLYLTGRLDSNSERSLYLTGCLGSNSERSLYLTGSLGSSSERNLYLGVVNTSNSERVLYLETIGYGSSEVAMYLSGVLGDSSERSLYLQGKTTGSSERALYTEVVNTGSSARNMYVPVDGGNYSDRFMYLSGEDTGGSERGLYVIGGYNNSGERSLYLEVVDTDSSERVLYVGVVGTDSSERSLYLIGSISDSGERNLYLEGFINEGSERSLYLTGSLSGDSERNLYLGVVNTGSSERSMYLGVVNEGTSERSLYITGSLGDGSERSLYLSTKGASSSYRNLYLTGSTTDSSERNLYLEVVSMGDSQRGLYITGCLSDNSERTLYLSVNQVGSSERGMWLHGGMVGDAEVYFWDGISWVEITALTVYT